MVVTIEGVPHVPCRWSGAAHSHFVVRVTKAVAITVAVVGNRSMRQGILVVAINPVFDVACGRNGGTNHGGHSHIAPAVTIRIAVEGLW